MDTSCNKLEDVLKQVYSARLTMGNRWLVWSEDAWIVCSREHRQKNTRILITTDNLEVAIIALRGSDRKT